MTFIPQGSRTTNSTSSPTTVRQAIAMLVFLGGLILAAIPVLSGLGTLMSALFGDLSHNAVSMIVLSGFAGVFAGVAGAVIKNVRFEVDPLAKSFLSAYFNRSLVDIRIDAAFWGRIVIGGLVGWMVGAWLTAAGFTSVPELFQGIFTLDNLTPRAGGGFGGAPPPADFFGIVFLLLLVLLAGPLAGFISGSVVSIALSMLAGVTKGIVKAYIEELLENPRRPAARFKDATMTGLFSGLMVGIIQAICTGIGIIRFAGG